MKKFSIIIFVLLCFLTSCDEIEYNTYERVVDYAIDNGKDTTFVQYYDTVQIPVGYYPAYTIEDNQLILFYTNGNYVTSYMPIFAGLPILDVDAKYRQINE